ncbi:MAG: LytTR family DNA-binding domain-containing protein [Lachnospiraceae bacterium]|nr:LytTR family DNA-binding domain-containing protein [Lachnospiraceae bacterium]
MIHVAICDDDPEMVAGHKQKVEECFKQLGSIGQITTYTSSDNILYDITEDEKFYDLVLLDIEMPGFSGMEVAGKIKPFLPNAKVIFITSHIEFAIDAFELFVFRYVPKQDMEKRLPLAISDAIRLLELEEGKSYTIQTNSRLEKIPYKDILYIMKDGKNAEITGVGGVSKVRKTLQQVYEELGAEEFIFIDRGCIVNIIHVMQIKDGTAVLKTGENLAVSRSHLQDVKDQINAYWGAHI